MGREDLVRQTAADGADMGAKRILLPWPYGSLVIHAKAGWTPIGGRHGFRPAPAWRGRGARPGCRQLRVLEGPN